MTLSNGDAYDDVSVLDFDSRKDLVLLRIKGFKMPAAEMGDSDSIAVGHKVYAIGAPRGLELTLTEGLSQWLARYRGRLPGDSDIRCDFPRQQWRRLV